MENKNTYTLRDWQKCINLSIELQKDDPEWLYYPVYVNDNMGYIIVINEQGETIGKL